MLGGTLEMDLTYINVPMNDGTISRFSNVPMTKVHVKEMVMLLELTRHMNQSKIVFLYFPLMICLSL
jgi:hypothetical protein